MNAKAQRHLATAKGFIARGEEFYRKAAAEIVAARNEGATFDECAEMIGKSPTWVKETLKWYLRNGQDPTPFAHDTYANRAPARAAKVLRDSTPEQVAEILSEPEVRANVSKALDRHYRQRAEEATQVRREREVERRGGPESDEEYRFGLRVAELVNTMRGVVSGLRFVCYEARGLNIAEAAPDSAEELRRLNDEARGFVSMFGDYLAGTEITDDDIAQLIGAGDGTHES